MHEAYDPNAVVDFLDADALTRQDSRDIDAFGVHADATASGDDDVAIVQRYVSSGKPRQVVGEAEYASAGAFMAKDSCGRSVLNSCTNASKRACCCKLFI